MHLGPLRIDEKFLKNFNMNMERAAIVTLACCVLYNFCEIYSKRVPLPEDVAHRLDPFVRVCRGAMRLAGDVRAGKVAGKQMRVAIFESWVARNPNV